MTRQTHPPTYILFYTLILYPDIFRDLYRKVKITCLLEAVRISRGPSDSTITDHKRWSSVSPRFEPYFTKTNSLVLQGKVGT